MSKEDRATSYYTLRADLTLEAKSQQDAFEKVARYFGDMARGESGSLPNAMGELSLSTDLLGGIDDKYQAAEVERCENERLVAAVHAIYDDVVDASNQLFVEADDPLEDPRCKTLSAAAQKCRNLLASLGDYVDD